MGGLPRSGRAEPTRLAGRDGDERYVAHARWHTEEEQRRFRLELSSARELRKFAERRSVL
jgi:hypothetical protein